MRNKKWLWFLVPVFLIGATVSPFRVYEILINKDKAFIDHDGLASFERLLVNDVEFDVSGLSTGDVLTFDGTGFGGAPATSGSWLSLSDTPDTYTANKLVRVNSGATGLELVDTFATTEAGLELQLTDVTNVYTNNDGLLTADDLSDNTLASLGTSTRAQLNTLIGDTVWTTAAPPTVLALSDVPDAYDTGKYLKSTGSGTVWDSPAGAGTVTSVAISGAGGITFTGSPITSSGTLAMTIDGPTLATYMGVPDTGTEVASMYDGQVGIMSQAVAEAGTSTVAYRITAERIKQAIDALGMKQFPSNVFKILDSSDATKIGSFNMASVPTGTEKIITWPSAALDLNSITDGFVSNTLTSSKFVGSGSTGDAVELDTAEVSGYLANSKLYPMGPSTFKGREAGPGGPPQDLSVAESLAILGVEAGADSLDNDDVTNAKLANMAQGTFKGQILGAGTVDPVDMTNVQARESISNIQAVTSTSNHVAWNSSTGSKISHTLSQNTTIDASSGTYDCQMAFFIITKASTYTLAWNASFVALDGLNASIPAAPTTAGDVGYYIFIWHPSPVSKWVLLAHEEYTP